MRRPRRMESRKPWKPQEAAGSPRRLQAPGGPRRAKEAPGEPRKSLGRPRRAQEAPGGPRRPRKPQEAPGGPRRAQEPPGRIILTQASSESVAHRSHQYSDSLILRLPHTLTHSYSDPPMLTITHTQTLSSPVTHTRKHTHTHTQTHSHSERPIFGFPRSQPIMLPSSYADSSYPPPLIFISIHAQTH